MADCVKCGKKLNFFNSSIISKDMNQEKICFDCESQEFDKKNAVVLSSMKNEADVLALKIESVILTTDYGHDLKILKRVEIVTAECAFGMNIFKDLFAGVRDIVGGRSEAVQKTMRDARKTALFELKREAHLVGANAVIGVDLDYVELSNVGSMIMLVASGTAVIIEE